MKGLLITVFVAATWSSASAQKCLKYGPTVSLTGTLYSKVFAGPPNYESIKHGDRKETAIILRLAKATCTAGDDPMGYDVSFTNIREMQLVVYSDDKSKNDEEWKTVHRRIGKQVVVTGTLFGAHTGHHRTKVLIQVSGIRAARSAEPRVLMQSGTSGQIRSWPELNGKNVLTFDWNCARTEVFQKAALRRQAQKAIPLDDRGRLGTWGDRAVRLRLTSKNMVCFVPLVCGTGGCGWRMYSLGTTKYLGEISGEGIYTYESLAAWPTIITYMHMSVAEGILTTYRFRSGKYRRVGDEFSVNDQGSFSDFYPQRKTYPMPKVLKKPQRCVKAMAHSMFRKCDSDPHES